MPRPSSRPSKWDAGEGGKLTDAHDRLRKKIDSIVQKEEGQKENAGTLSPWARWMLRP